MFELLFILLWLDANNDGPPWASIIVGTLCISLLLLAGFGVISLFSLFI